MFEMFLCGLHAEDNEAGHAVQVLCIPFLALFTKVSPIDDSTIELVVSPSVLLAVLFIARLDLDLVRVRSRQRRTFGLLR